MTTEELRVEIDVLFNPEHDPDLEPRPLAPSSLTKRHPLDFSYLNTFDWEGSSTHKYTRICPADGAVLLNLQRSMHVPDMLFMAGLRQLADSMLAYNGVQKREGDIRYYPPTILTFWSGFETFVRELSEKMLLTVEDIPSEIRNYIHEVEPYADERGEVKERTKYQSVVNRYWMTLRYAYGYKMDRGGKYWQALEAARKLRDYYSHLDVHEPKAVSSADVLRFMEAILMAIIFPSTELKRTLSLYIYDIYRVWSWLHDRAAPYVEKPPLMDWNLSEPIGFYCNFENVDVARFPNSKELMERSRRTE